VLQSKLHTNEEQASSRQLSSSGMKAAMVRATKEFNMKIAETAGLITAAVSALSVACASHPPPTDHMASAIAAVRGAQVAVAGAGQVPEASLQLKLAEEQVAQARKMIENGDNERADYMTLRAYNDAELALALARQHQAREGARQAEKRAAEPADTALPPAAPGAAP
jgi:Domain of unknown function (DUF4398)